MEVKSTEREDFKRIYQANYSLLMQVIMHIVYSLDIAEDLTQETFERFYLKNLTFPSDDEAKYWLLRVAKNLALNYVRKNKRDLNLVEKVKAMPQEVIYKEDQDRHLIEQESTNRVKLALSQLPENLRLVLELKEFSNLDYKEIGKVLGISASNVKVRVFRARKKLEELLGGEERDVY